MKLSKNMKHVIIGTSAFVLAMGSCLSVNAATGNWKQDGANWFYIEADGSVQKGWLLDNNGIWYYLNPSAEGLMSTGWVWDNGTWYFTDASGAMQTGLVNVAGKVYYLNPISDGTKGAMQIGTVTINEKEYTFDESGAAYGTIPTASARFNSDGSKVVTSSGGGGGSSSGGSASGGYTVAEKEKAKEIHNIIAKELEKVDDENFDIVLASNTTGNVALTVKVKDNADLTVADVDAVLAGIVIEDMFDSADEIVAEAGGVKKTFKTYAEAEEAYVMWLALNGNKDIESVNGYKVGAVVGSKTVASYTLIIK